MAEQDRGSDDPRLAAIARHALHDEELIAAYAAGDVDDAADAERAHSLVDRCPTCQALHADLGRIRSAIQASGSAAQRSSTTRASRDFRLTAEDAARLRPGSPVKRLAVRLGWRARLGLGVVAFGRPVGAALATFGVVGLLVGTLTLGGTPFAAMSAAGPSSAPGVDQAGQGPESSSGRGSYGPMATAKGATPEVAQPGAGGGLSEEGGDGPGGSLLLLLVSAALVLVGIGFIVFARRSPRPATS